MGCVEDRRLGSVREAPALIPLICKVFQAHLECLHEINLLMSVQAWWTPAHIMPAHPI